MPLVDPPQPSPVEADLPVSWNTGATTRYWYRVEGKCAPADCENLGVQFEGCDNVLILTTVSAGSVPELCEVLTNPRTNAPLVSEIVSIRRYSRPVFRADIEAGQCNVLEQVEFCQIPECFDFCPEPATPASFMRRPPSRPRRNARPPSLGGLVSGPYPFPLVSESGEEILSASGDPIFGVMETPYTAEFDFGSEEETFPLFTEYDDEFLLESGEEMLGEAYIPSPATPGLFFSGSAEVSCTFYAHDFSGSLEFGGFAYFVSPRASFQGSGSLQVSGTGRLVSRFTASGVVAVSGSAVVSPKFDYGMSGGAVVSGSSSNESPYFSYETSGSVVVAGAAYTNFFNLGTIEVPTAMAATVFGMGLESLEPTIPSELTISAFEVSACGCSGIGPTISMRHNLNSSLAFSQFLGSAGLSYPSSLPLRYRTADKVWSSVDYLKGRSKNWTVSASMQCQTDSWRLSLGVSEGSKQTRLVLDIPADIVCGDRYVTTSVVAYFNSYSPGGSGVRINVVTPDKSRYLSVLGEVDAFVDGIFVPQTVYYDELGLFKDEYWLNAPLEIDLNPVARNKSTLMDISWV